jgi:hypothetical protein
MPRFFLDLLFDRDVVLDPGGLLFECPAGAVAAADELARQVLHSQLGRRSRRGWIRVRDERGNEIHRSRIGPDRDGINAE